MGQPITLHKGDETIIVYGKAQAAIHMGEGWALDTGEMKPPAPPVTPDDLPPVEIDATEAAVKLAEESGVDLSTVTGTGKDGRIGINDVRTAMGDE